MKLSPKYLFFILTGIVFVVIIWFLFKVTRTDYTYTIPAEKECSSENDFNLTPHLLNWDSSNFLGSFPYSIYLDSSDICNVSAIAGYLAAMDSVNSDFSNNRQIISIALTDSLQSRIFSSLKRYNPDSLIIMMQWAEKFNQYKAFDRSNAKLYRVIYKHWLSFTANQLGEYYNSNPQCKYDFKFNYLSAICQSKNFSVPVGNTNSEKIVFNMINKNYAYLFSKFWYDTGYIYKLLILLIVGITGYGYYCIFKVHLKLKKK